MGSISIFNQTDREIEELKTVEDVLKSAVKKENLVNTTFNLIIVDNEYIHELNKNYRHIDRETDVITFALEDDDSLVMPTDERILGDIYISIDKAISQAEEYGHSLRREMCFLFTHGILHLLGYDHMTDEQEKEMFGLQDEILGALSIEREGV